MATGQLIRIVVVDDHDVVRQGLQVFLSAFADLELVGEAKNGLTAVSVCAAAHPDIVLMDISMPAMDGVEATHHILRNQPDVKIIGLTSFVEDGSVQALMDAGATGFLLKNTGARELADAIRAVASGRYILAPEAAQALLRSKRNETTNNYQLSPRELEVLALMIKGLNNIDIADKLIVSRSTIKFHVSSILSKLGVSSRTEAVAVALEKKLVT